MKTYTAGTTPLEVIEECLPHKYPMELNKHDMLMLLNALNEIDACVEPNGEEGEDNNLEWARNFRSCILTTIGIEEV